MLRNEKDLKVGAPYLEGIKVQATVEDHIRDSKVVVFKYKKRKNYRRTKGHRQDYTVIKVTDIAGA